jgi:hypothetical protein
VLCTREGVQRLEFVGGEGNDAYFSGSTLDVDIPVHADMGDGNDWVDMGSTGNDFITLGPGNDHYVDAGGDDYVDAGPGNDDVSGGDFSTGNDVVLGGEGDDNLDGLVGDDFLDGGPGNDLLQPGEGNDTLLGGDGDDVIGGVAGGCFEDPGDDTMRGGAGNDQLCGGPGADTLDGGDGDDSLNSVDGHADGPTACGAGTDAVWSDRVDSVDPDCELRDDGRAVTLPAPNIVPVAIPCAAGTCKGTVAIFATPKAPAPSAAAAPPLTPPKAAGKALAQAKFKLKQHASRTVKLRLTKAATNRLRKLGATTVEARTTFTKGGKRYSVRQTFRVRPARRRALRARTCHPRTRCARAGSRP